MSGSISKTIVKSSSSSSSSKKLFMSNKTGLALKWLIANIVLIVQDAGYIIDHSESKVYRGSYIFYIKNQDIDPLRSTIISSVDIALMWDNTILKIPRTRSLKRITADIFYIQLVKTNPNHRNEGWATLLLIYTIAYLQIKMPAIKIFKLSDESANSRHINNNIYTRLGFIYMDKEAMNISQHARTIPTTQKKILDFNIEPIYSWVTVRCLNLIIDSLKNEPMLLALIKPFKSIEPSELIGGKSKKQRKHTRKQAKRTRKHSKKHSRKH
jgi:hypothetical protein